MDKDTSDIDAEQRKMLLKATILVIGFSFIIFLVIGVLIGFSLAMEKMTEYLSWWKVVNDCGKCQNWNCQQVAEGYSYFREGNISYMYNISNMNLSI